MNFSPRPAEEPEITLISLIDVVLMLVIFFMLSSTFLEEGRMKIQLPSADESVATPPQESLVVTVTAEGGYRVNERELVNAGRETLRNAILEVAGESRDGEVILRADGRATHQSVVTAMDVLGRMGFAGLKIATVEPSAAQ